MTYKGKKIIRVLGYIKGNISIMILQYADRSVEVVRN